MTGTNEFSTKRLLMRRYRPDDARVLYEKFGRDPVMYEYSGWNPYATYEMARDTVQRFISSCNDPDFYGWAIEFQGQLIGTVGAYDYDPPKNRIETGISIERPLWGQGFATEALIGVLKYLTEHEGIEVVTAWCAAENTGSMKAMRKSGMEQTAVEKDALEINGKKFEKLIYQYSSRGIPPAKKKNEIVWQAYNMNIQIFGTKKSADTRKAERFFKERGIKYQFIDLKEKGLSKGEFQSVLRSVGSLDAMIDKDCRDEELLALIRYIVPENRIQKVLENQIVLKQPIVRNGQQATVGYAPDIWKDWK